MKEDRRFQPPQLHRDVRHTYGCVSRTGHEDSTLQFIRLRRVGRKEDAEMASEKDVSSQPRTGHFIGNPGQRGGGETSILDPEGLHPSRSRAVRTQLYSRIRETERLFSKSACCANLATSSEACLQPYRPRVWLWRRWAIET
jgi:hypothetical protein